MDYILLDRHMNNFYFFFFKLSLILGLNLGLSVLSLCIINYGLSGLNLTFCLLFCFLFLCRCFISLRLDNRSISEGFFLFWFFYIFNGLWILFNYRVFDWLRVFFRNFLNSVLLFFLFFFFFLN